MSAEIDLNAPATYPIILSEALQGRGTKEVYTGIRYNHKPDTVSPSAIRLSPPTDDDNYNLTLPSTTGSDHEYTGLRTSNEDQYILIFDAEKKCFVLHQLDSSFDMNLSGPDASQYTSLSALSSKSGAKQPTRRKSSTSKGAKPPARRKAARKQESESEEDDSDDGGLEIEYPDGPRSRGRGFAAPMGKVRDARRIEVEEDIEGDAEGESEEGEEDVEGEVEDLDAHLEAELAAALEKEFAGDGSSESEEE